MLSEFAHEGTAKLSDLVVRFTLGVEICTALTATHVQAGQCILEDLLKSQEFQDGQIDSGMESETALVGAKRRVELNSVSTVDLDLALVVLPDDSELDDALGYRGDLQGFLVFGVLLEERRVLKGGDQLPVCLLELRL